MLPTKPELCQNRLLESNTAVTASLISITIFVFIFQSALYLRAAGISTGIPALLFDITALEGLNAFLFMNFPWISWPHSPFIHRGIFHFIFNIVFLVLLGRILEPKFQRRYFILWFISVAVIAKPVHAYIALETTTNTYVAVYGISDFVFSLAFFSFPYLLFSENRNGLESIGLFVSVSAVLLVAFNIAVAVSTTSIDPINPSHLVGGLHGLAVLAIVKIRD